MVLYNTTFSVMWPTVTPKSLLPSNALWLRGNIKNSGHAPGSSSCDASGLPAADSHTCHCVLSESVTALAVNPKKESRLVSSCSRRVWECDGTENSQHFFFTAFTTKGEITPAKRANIGMPRKPYRKARKQVLEMGPQSRLW